MKAVTVLAIAVLAAAACPASSQEPRMLLTLEEALELASRNNPAYLRAAARADASGADVRAGFGAFLPSLTGSLSWSGNSRTIVTGEDDFGRPIALPDPLTFRSSSASQGLSTGVTLFDGLTNFSNYRAAKAGAASAEANVDLAEATLAAEVERRFYTALQAQRLIDVEEQLLEVSRRQLDATQRLFRVAARTEVDVLGAQVQVAQQEQALEQARGDARKAALRLSELIGLDETVAFRVSGDLPSTVDRSLLDVDDLAAQALAQNPRIRSAEADAAQADFAASAAAGRRWPTVTARASFGRAVSLSSYDALFKFDPRDRSLGFGIDVQIPLFTRFQTSLAIAQATANARVAEENLREQRMALEREVRSAYIDLATAERRLELAERAVDLGRRRLTMAQEQYQLGTIGFTDFQQIVTQTSQDARQLLSAEGEYARALVTLAELAGAGVR